MTSLPVDDFPQPRLDWRELLTRLGPVIGLLFVYVLFAALVNIVPGALRFSTPENAELMMRQTAVVGTACLGMTLVIISGGIDLSVGSNLALTTVVITLALKAGFPATVAALLGITSAALCGSMIGILTIALRLPPFIITLGLWGALRGLAKGMAGNQVVYPPISWTDTWLRGLLKTLPARDSWMLVPAGVWLMIFLAVFVALLLRYTRFGRHVFAIGSNEQTARLCGVPVERTRLLIYLLSGMFVGIAGVLEFSYISCGDPTTRNGAELDVIAAVVIGGASLSGGQGSVFGSMVGALIMAMVANGCGKLNQPNWVQEIVTGVIIVLAVALDRLRDRKSA